MNNKIYIKLENDACCLYSQFTLFNDAQAGECFSKLTEVLRKYVNEQASADLSVQRNMKL